MDPVDLLEHEYHRRLHDAGVPRDASKRTPAQQQLAAATYWAAQSEFLVQVGSLSQSAVED